MPAMRRTVTRSQNAAEPSSNELARAELEIIAGGTSGAGAGKVTFNPFSITRKTD